MLRQSVSSSNLASVGYDALTHTLEIEFLNGSVYQYSGVPSTVFQGLMGAASHGTYFNAYIKNVYSYRRI
ncbi:MAG: KTSC domain-containing protein [Verrucomicrobiota bacterium]|nr:KTSC domain-containing protein [Verrucomicrobiota bacterium]